MVEGDFGIGEFETWHTHPALLGRQARRPRVWREGWGRECLHVSFLSAPGDRPEGRSVAGHGQRSEEAYHLSPGWEVHSVAFSAGPGSFAGFEGPVGRSDRELEKAFEKPQKERDGFCLE